MSETREDVFRALLDRRLDELRPAWPEKKTRQEARDYWLRLWEKAEDPAEIAARYFAKHLQADVRFFTARRMPQMAELTEDVLAHHPGFLEDE